MPNSFPALMPHVHRPAHARLPLMADANMNRIFKYYSFAWHAPAAAKTIAFSSYPGYLESLDDFYMMGDTQLAVVQTTNGIYNTSPDRAQI